VKAEATLLEEETGTLEATLEPAPGAAELLLEELAVLVKVQPEARLLLLSVPYVGLPAARGELAESLECGAVLRAWGLIKDGDNGDDDEDNEGDGVADNAIEEGLAGEPLLNVDVLELLLPRGKVGKLSAERVRRFMMFLA